MTNPQGQQPLSVNRDFTTTTFRNKEEMKRYWILIILFAVASLLAIFGLLVYNNPVPIDSPSFPMVAQRRLNGVIAMLIAATCQSLSTVAFQTVTRNRVITPSLLGFEAVYSTVQTAFIFFAGTAGLLSLTGNLAFIAQVAIMVLVCVLLYGSLLKNRKGDLQLMLLLGIILGQGLRALSSFMRRMLSPSEFDILQARLFGSVNNAESEYFIIAVPLVLVTAFLLLREAKVLNIVALGSDVATNLGVDYQKRIKRTLTYVAILMAVSTALIGPITFFGFLVSIFAYQLTPTYDNRYIFPMALLLGFLVLTGSYFLMNHVFNAQGVVSIIIELVGGLAFLAMIFRKGEL